MPQLTGRVHRLDQLTGLIPANRLIRDHLRDLSLRSRIGRYKVVYRPVSPDVTLIAVDAQRFRCSCCGEMLDGRALAWHFDAPVLWSSLSAADRKRRGQLTSDQCVIDDEHFFVRGLVE